MRREDENHPLVGRVVQVSSIRIRSPARAGVLLAVALFGVVAVCTFVRWQYPLRYPEAVREYAGEASLDPILVAAVIRVESRFRADAVSPRGALGLMQVMPETGRWIAAQLGVAPFTPEMLFDPFLNLRMGTWYLAHLWEEFHGDPVLALAAYNGGRGRVREWIRRKGWSPGDENTSFPVQSIPYGETRRFVTAVLRDVGRYRLLHGRQLE
ncbi:MAG TPA: lytic transglycosylase [Clostridiales bacterium]|nr:lytic transglycosylase [Clostridiales bacterium]